MKKPTKRQRHAIYKEALKRFDYCPMGLYITIEGADGGRWAKWWWEVAELYPEFAEVYGPGENYRSKLFEKESDDTDNRIRRRALLRCIELTRPSK